MLTNATASFNVAQIPQLDLTADIGTGALQPGHKGRAGLVKGIHVWGGEEEKRLCLMAGNMVVDL
jgi:hypothetical protein